MRPRLISHSAKAIALFVGLLTLCFLAGCGSGSTSSGNASTDSSAPQIQISPSNPSLYQGQTLQLKATAVYPSGTQQDVTTSTTWKTSAATVAAVGSTGNLTAMAVGTAQITGVYQGVSGTSAVTVSSAALQTITITPAVSSFPIGESQQLSATGTYSDGTTRDLTAAVTWVSSQTSVAGVNAAGMMTANAVGSSTISATSSGITGSAQVAVTSAALQTITVTPAASSLPIGESQQLSATGTYSDGSTKNLTAAVTWVSSQTSVAGVNAAGLMTANAVGSSTISATSSGITGSAQVAVTAAVAVSLSIAPSTLSMFVGGNSQLAATAIFSNGTQQNVTGSATWKTSAGSVATVGSTGVLTATGVGSAQITALYQGVSGTSAVTVNAVTLQTIVVNPSSSSLPIGESQQLSATGTYSDGTIKDLTATVFWTSSQTSVVAVTGKGAVTANALGTSTLTATTSGISGSAQVTATPAVAVSLAITPATLSMLVGSNQQLYATFTYSDGSTQDATSQVLWSSNAPNTVSMTDTGVAAAQQVGTATISASGANLNADAPATVIPLALVSYFDLASAQTAQIDGTLRLTNPGLTGGDLCAMIYVFDSNQEMNECCGCIVSDAGLLELSLENDLTSNPLTGIKPSTGAIRVVPSDPTSNPQCDASSLAPTAQLVGWETNVHVDSSNTVLTVESTSAAASLTTDESSSFAGACAAIKSLGSGQGVCSCGSGNPSSRSSLRYSTGRDVRALR